MSKQKKLCRFQEPPPFWGPGSKPKGAMSRNQRPTENKRKTEEDDPKIKAISFILL